MSRLTSRRVCHFAGFLFILVALAAVADAADGAQAVVGSVVQGVPPPPGAQGQPRDTMPARRVGTAVIRGRVIDGGTGNPVPRARVRVMSGPPTFPPVLTDGQGAFEFLALPSGAYTVMVEKATYMPARVPEPPGTTLRGRMRPFILRDGQVAEGLTVPLFHGGVITGRILDSHGDPVEYAQVRAARAMRSGRPPTMAQVQTNDLGEYRLPRLATGRYIIQVRPQMQQGPFQEGTPSEVPLPQPMPTYYPSAPSAAQAQPIAVTRGETLSGMDITLTEGTPSVVTGTVVRADGEPVVAGSVSARTVGSESFGGFDFGGGTGIRQGGTFRLTLAPGDYVLEAETGRPGPGQMQDAMTGNVRISVGGGAVEAVTVVVGRGATATGRVVFEGTTPPPRPPVGPVNVPMFNPDGPGCRQGQATVASDWTFKVEGLSGTCAAQPMGMLGRWTLKSVTYRGQNLADQLVTFESGQQYANLEVVVTDKRTSVDLHVIGDDGQPTKEYVAIAFPVEKSKWNQQSRRVRIFMPPTSYDMAVRSAMPPPPGAGPGANATPPPERFQNLPMGEYFFVAVDDIGNDDWQDPDVLERLSSSATRATVTDDAPIDLQLRRVTLAEVVR